MKVVLFFFQTFVMLIFPCVFQFSSHQLFHILVLAATLVNCHAIFIVASLRFGIGCPANENGFDGAATNMTGINNPSDCDLYGLAGTI